MQETKVTIPDIVGHRGFSGNYPENTMVSFEKAIEANASALEGDIRLTKDKELIMMHDMKLDRTTTGSGKIGDVQWHGYIDGLTTKTSPPQKIPRFRDVLDLLVTKEVAEKNMFMIVDIKFDNPVEILEHVHQLLTSEHYAKHKEVLARTLVIGIWHTDFLSIAQDLFKDYKLCFIGLSLVPARKHFVHHVDYLSVPFATLCDNDGQAFIKEVHELDKRVITWTINDVEQLRTCVRWGVDVVVGDHVTTMVQHVHGNVASLSPQELQTYVKEDTYLESRRNRWYYSLLKKGMHHVSRQFIGM